MLTTQNYRRIYIQTENSLKKSRYFRTQKKSNFSNLAFFVNISEKFGIVVSTIFQIVHTPIQSMFEVYDSILTTAFATKIGSLTQILNRNTFQNFHDFL